MQGVEIINVADLKQRYEADIVRICDTLGLSREFAVIALRAYKWCDFISCNVCADYSVEILVFKGPSNDRRQPLHPCCRDAHRFLDSWYENPDKIRISVGIPPSEHNHEHHEHHGCSPNREVCMSTWADVLVDRTLEHLHIVCKWIQNVLYLKGTHIVL